MLVSERPLKHVMLYIKLRTVLYFSNLLSVTNSLSVSDGANVPPAEMMCSLFLGHRMGNLQSDLLLVASLNK